MSHGVTGYVSLIFERFLMALFPGETKFGSYRSFLAKRNRQSTSDCLTGHTAVYGPLRETIGDFDDVRSSHAFGMAPEGSW